MSLLPYRRKRHAEATPEPFGGATGAGGKADAAASTPHPLRFVVQKHAASSLHYDFRLELDGVLKSWAVPKGPSLDPENKHLAIAVEDHPLEYRDFEGVIPEGNYGGGTVMIWDEGTYTDLLERPYSEAVEVMRQGLIDGHLVFKLHGKKLNGEFALIKLHNGAKDNAWLLIKARKDDFVTTKDVTKKDRSVKTGRTMGQIAAGAPIKQLLDADLTGAPRVASGSARGPVEPMLATTTEAPPTGDNWQYEIKWDGFRLQAEVNASGVKLWSRNGQDYTARFAPVAEELAALAVPALIDGEVVVVDASGRSSFQALQNYLRGGLPADAAGGDGSPAEPAGDGRLVYYAFDLLRLDGRDLTGLPLSRRFDLLERALPPGQHLKTSGHIVGDGLKLLAAAAKQNLEGLMIKRADSAYQPGRRSGDWLKLKTHHRQEMIIIGWTDPGGSRQNLGSLALGFYDARRRLTYAGHVGSGFNDQDLAELAKLLAPLAVEICPVNPTPKGESLTHWVKPELVCEVQFTEWTVDNQLRHPVFVGLRSDKPAAKVVREEPAATAVKPTADPAPTAGSKSSPAAAHHTAAPGHTAVPNIVLRLNGHEVTVTHPTKIYWPEKDPAQGATKLDLIKYYQSVAPTLLPYLKDRPESLNRHPHGILGEHFYQKNLVDHPSWAKTTDLHSDEAERIVHYLLCQDEATLAYMNNLGCIEINPWSSRVGHLDNPDYCVIDLDPEGIGFDAVIKVAQTVHAVLTELGIPGYPKTTGATGIHIFIPMGVKYTYDQVRDFAHLLVQLVHDRLPELTSLERHPEKRQGKVYLDYLQNSRGQTLACAYSVRPQPGATVSAPLAWSEVKAGLTPQMFTIRDMAARLKLDAKLWQPVLGAGIKMPEIIAKLEKYPNNQKEPQRES